MFVLFTMFFGGGLIPTYLWFRSLGLLNTRFILILPHIASAFYIIIMRNFFQEIPAELEESAVLDGAGIFTLLVRIVAPLSLPVIATVGLWSVVFHWNEWFNAMIFAARRDLIVLQLLLRRILIENQTAEWLELASEESAIRGPDRRHHQGGDHVRQRRTDHHRLPLHPEVLRKGDNGRIAQGLNPPVRRRVRPNGGVP